MIFPRKFKHSASCIKIIRRKEGKGYAPLNYEREHWLAHRLSYHLNIHPIPRRAQPKKKGVWGSAMVLHKCGNKWCINPEHLYLGNHSNNSKDFWNLKVDRSQFCSKMKAVCSDPEYRIRMVEATRGIKKTEEHKRKIGEGRKGKLMSEESKKKMSILAKARCARVDPKEMRRRMKALAEIRHGLR